jgi:prolipoprotein diacylglyceryltransferase
MTIATDPRFHLLFDVLAWVSAALLGWWLYEWRLRPVTEGVGRDLGVGYALSLAVGAVVGAWALGSGNTSMFPVPHLSHSILGALVGGIIAVELYKWRYAVSGSTGVLWVGPLALGIAVGRIGCFLSGLSDETYGIPTNAKWGVDLGDGVLRHPVQLYESAAMLAFLFVYLVGLRRRTAWTTTRSFYLFVGYYGAQRFAWEFFKPYPRIVAGLDIFQLCALALIAYAFVLVTRARRIELSSRTNGSSYETGGART